MYVPHKYRDPATRLAIKISGISKIQQKELCAWIVKDGDGDRWLPRINRFVDWLEDLDPTVLRPRRNYHTDNESPNRYYTDELYTRHPLDVGDVWNQPVTYEEFR